MARNCHGFRLDTFEFQAREFYKKLGFHVFSEWPDYPKDFSRFFMGKALNPQEVVREETFFLIHSHLWSNTL